MQRIKTLLLMALCVLLLTSCARHDVLVTETFPTAPSVTYQTVTVEKGTFTITRQCNASFVYPDNQIVYCGYNGAILKEDFKISRQAKVKAGDVLATVYFDVSESQLMKLELAYSEAVRALNDTSEAYEARIAQYDNTIAAGGTDGQIAALQKKQAQNEYRLYLNSAEADVENKRKALSEYRDMFGEKVIVAPADGVVNWSADFKAGTVLGEKTVMLTYYTDSYALLRLNQPSADMLQIALPGAPVTITDNKVTIEGVIVTSPTGLDSFASTGSVFVHSEEMDKLGERNNYKVICQGAQLEDMIMLSSRAIHTEDNVQYVFVLENGVATRRNVICGLQNDGLVCILSGLEPGQQVILNQGG